MPGSLTVTTLGSGAGTVTSEPAGIDCGWTCLFSFPAGSRVTLTATPTVGSAFLGWSGACAGAGPCTLTAGPGVGVGALFAQAPSAAISGVAATAGGEWTFAATAFSWSGEIVHYGWQFGDGSNSTGETAVHTYREPGTYAVTLTVTDEQGAQGSTTETLTVLPPDPATPVLPIAAPVSPIVKPTRSSNAKQSVVQETDAGTRLASAAWARFTPVAAALAMRGKVGADLYLPGWVPPGYRFRSWQSTGPNLLVVFGRGRTSIVWRFGPAGRRTCGKTGFLASHRVVAGRRVYYGNGRGGHDAAVCLRSAEQRRLVVSAWDPHALPRGTLMRVAASLVSVRM